MPLVVVLAAVTALGFYVGVLALGFGFVVLLGVVVWRRGSSLRRGSASGFLLWFFVGV